MNIVKNPAWSRPLSANVRRLMKQAREFPDNPDVIKGRRRMTDRDYSYCSMQGEIFMAAVDLGYSMEDFAPMYMCSQLAGVMDHSFSRSGKMDEDGVAGMLKGTDFEGLLQSVLEAQFNTGVQLADERNKALEKQAEAMRLSILGKDSKARDDKPLEVVEAYVKENTTELVDPLGAEKRMAELKEKKEKLISELETQIKVSNATTVIEF